MEEKKIINEENMEEAAGGEWRPDSKMAKVYALDGGPVKMYNTSISGNDPFWQVPSGSEMKVDPNLEPETPCFFDRVYEAGYWACYNYRWLFIKEKEVNIEWL